VTALATIGHNNPPPSEVTKTLDIELRVFLREHPVIQSPAEANLAAGLTQRAKNTLADIEADRKRLVGPLNDQVKSINAEYGEAASPIQSGLILLKGRMTDYAAAEELRRQEIAEALRIEAKAAEERASQAIRDAQEAVQNASFGEAVDVVTAKQDAVRAFNDARRADRAFARAERDAEHVRLAPGLGARAMSLRSQTELTVTDATLAIGAMGLTETIAEAILTSARAYKKLKGNYPPGIAVNQTRSI
jgi:hypothetical protein